MTHADQIDWVQVFKHRFPHEAHVPDDSFVHNSRFHWCRTHVGARGVTWEFPCRGVYMFKEHEHAVLFSLTWS